MLSSEQQEKKGSVLKVLKCACWKGGPFDLLIQNSFRFFGKRTRNLEVCFDNKFVDGIWRRSRREAIWNSIQLRYDATAKFVSSVDLDRDPLFSGNLNPWRSVQILLGWCMSKQTTAIIIGGVSVCLFHLTGLTYILDDSERHLVVRIEKNGPLVVFKKKEAFFKTVQYSLFKLVHISLIRIGY